MNNKPATLPPNRIQETARRRYATGDRQQPIAVQVLQRQAFQDGAQFALDEMRKMGALPTTAKFLP